MSFLRRSGRINPNLSQNQNQNMGPGMGMGMNMGMNMNMNMKKNSPYGGFESQQFHRQGGMDQDKSGMFQRQRYFQNSQYQQDNRQQDRRQQDMRQQNNRQQDNRQQDNRNQDFRKDFKVENKTDVMNSGSKPILPVPPPLQMKPVEKPEEFVQQQQAPSPDVSATTKALAKVENEEGKEKRKKSVKLPASIRRKKLNQRLSKVLAPKSALLLLHELKPSIVYKIQEQPALNHSIFVATVEDNNVVLGTGQGLSKSLAKNVAAENAIKNFVSKAMNQQKANQDDKKDDEDLAENLPWAGLASFAMYKLFTEWQSQGADLPITMAASAAKPKVPKIPTGKKDLPPNALELHPAVLLNVMHPGLLAVEVSRDSGPNGNVTMGYSLDGHLYTGIARNKKDAKKEAAKAIISALYGLTYDS